MVFMTAGTTAMKRTAVSALCAHLEVTAKRIQLHLYRYRLLVINILMNVTPKQYCAHGIIDKL